jgi:SMC interacting uncharacterized protein involved in chromosome segregation
MQNRIENHILQNYSDNEYYTTATNVLKSEINDFEEKIKLLEAENNLLAEKIILRNSEQTISDRVIIKLQTEKEELDKKYYDLEFASNTFKDELYFAKQKIDELENKIRVLESVETFNEKKASEKLSKIAKLLNDTEIKTHVGYEILEIIQD